MAFSDGQLDAWSGGGRRPRERIGVFEKLATTMVVLDVVRC